VDTHIAFDVGVKVCFSWGYFSSWMEAIAFVVYLP